MKRLIIHKLGHGRKFEIFFTLKVIHRKKEPTQSLTKINRNQSFLRLARLNFCWKLVDNEMSLDDYSFIIFWRETESASAHQHKRKCCPKVNKLNVKPSAKVMDQEGWNMEKITSESVWSFSMNWFSSTAATRPLSIIIMHLRKVF